jgi:SAM-dependent methyltransferase
LAERGRRVFTERFDDVAVAPLFAKALSAVVTGSSETPPLTVMARLRQPFIDRVLRHLAPRSILEVGAGQGATGARLARHGKYVGVEPDLASAAVAASRLAHIDGAQFRMGGIERVSVDEVFDLVCAFEVIEHIEDDLGALRKWARHLADDGHILISVPAHMRRFGASDAAVGHFRRYDAIDLDRLFDSLGFEIVERRAYGAIGGHILESVRNAIISRRGGNVDAAANVAEKTAGSGRLFQPKSKLAGAITAAVAAPMRAAQRPFSSGQFGVGWVVLARRKRGTV